MFLIQTLGVEGVILNGIAGQISRSWNLEYYYRKSPDH